MVKVAIISQIDNDLEIVKIIFSLQEEINDFTKLQDNIIILEVKINIEQCYKWILKFKSQVINDSNVQIFHYEFHVGDVNTYAAKGLQTKIKNWKNIGEINSNKDLK